MFLNPLFAFCFSFFFFSSASFCIIYPILPLVLPYLQPVFPSSFVHSSGIYITEAIPAKQLWCSGLLIFIISPCGRGREGRLGNEETLGGLEQSCMDRLG